MSIETTTFNGQPAVRLRAADGAQAVVLLHGAHIVSWQTPDGVERMFLSERAHYGNGESVRGGVPIGGGTFYYQVWYRNAASFCTAATFNLTNGLEITWLP